MQLCSWKQPGQLECSQVAWLPPLALGFGLLDISSEIGPSPAANGSAVAPCNHLLRVKTEKEHLSLNVDREVLEFEKWMTFAVYSVAVEIRRDTTKRFSIHNTVFSCKVTPLHFEFLQVF